MSNNFPSDADIAAAQKDRVLGEPLLQNNVLCLFPHLSLAPLMGRGVIYPVFGSRNQDGGDEPHLVSPFGSACRFDEFWSSLPLEWGLLLVELSCGGSVWQVPLIPWIPIKFLI